MCGIGGIIKVTPPSQAAAALALPARGEGGAIPEAWLDILDESIRHRGPDGQGRFRDRVVRADGSVVDVALVHRRLAIIDPATGQQPMVSVRGSGRAGGASNARSSVVAAPARGAMTPLLFHGKPNAAVVYEGMREVEANGQDAHATGGTDLVAVVFNGCIYNHRELRRELLAAGHEFASDHSDTEVLLHGWREWGEGLFEKLDGMFALAIWDRLAAKLVMARDWFGEKPLFSIEGKSASHELSAFSSAAPGLTRLRCGPFACTASSAAAGDWHGIKAWAKFGWNRVAFSWEPKEETIGSHKFLSGASEVEPGARSQATTLAFGAVTNPSGVSISAQQVDAMLARSVQMRLEADVPVGCFLSGGVDSSLMAYYAHRTHPDLAAFTVRMPAASFDESPVAASVAAHLGMRHKVLECDPHPAEDLVRLINQLGLPFGDSSLLPTFWVSRAVREVAKVAIGGDGGDELFLGYDRHRAIRWLGWLKSLPAPVRRKLADIVTSDRDPKSMRTRLSRLLNAVTNDGYKELVAIFPPPFDSAVGLRRSDERGWGAIRHFGMTSMGGAGQIGAMDADTALALRFDRLFYLPHDILRKTDTASMSVALEVRAPFLDHTLALAAMNAPVSCLMPRGQRKGLLRQVARKYFPAEIVDRPKQGFAIPIGEWFRSDYGGMKQLLMDHLQSAEPWGPPRLGIELNMQFVRQMLDEHMSERRDHSQRLYMLLVLSIWAKWMGGL